MPLAINTLKNLLRHVINPISLRNKTTAAGDTINDHSINHHIYQEGPIIAQNPARGIDYIPDSPGYWFKWRNTANTNTTTEDFKQSFAVFNYKILNRILSSKRYENAVNTSLEDDPQRPNHYSVEIPFSDADFNALFLHSGPGGRRDPLYDLHGPSSRSLQRICINIDNNLITSIMPLFNGNPRDGWDEH